VPQEDPSCQNLTERRCNQPALVQTPVRPILIPPRQRAQKTPSARKATATAGPPPTIPSSKPWMSRGPRSLLPRRDPATHAADRPSQPVASSRRPKKRALDGALFASISRS
jgi:hypothetical protein